MHLAWPDPFCFPNGCGGPTPFMLPKTGSRYRAKAKSGLDPFLFLNMEIVENVACPLFFIEDIKEKLGVKAKGRKAEKRLKREITSYLMRAHPVNEYP